MKVGARSIVEVIASMRAPGVTPGPMTTIGTTVSSRKAVRLPLVRRCVPTW